MIVPEAPRATIISVAVQRAGRWQQYLAALSAVYLVASMGIGYYYLHLVRPSLASDLWWRGFTTAGAQTFLGDLYHRRLQLSTSAPLSLASPELVLEKAYSGATFMDMSLSLSRHVLLRNLSLESILPPMRRSSFDWNIRMFTQYCWVDWNQSYELSVTAARQRRCYLKQAANAAVYWEPLLRNSVTQDIVLSPYSLAMNISLFEHIDATSLGHDWLMSLMFHEWLPEADEVELWRRRGMSYWQTQLTNYYEQGLQQTIVVENALGIHQNVTVHLMAQSYRGLALWTLANAYPGVWNDLFECQALRCSLIRGANSYSDKIKQNWEVMLLAIPVNDTLPRLIDANIGPMASIDVRIVLLPPALQAYYIQYQRSVVAQLLLSPAIAARYMQVPSLVAAISPPAWRGANMSYFGGNPMCLNAKPQPFVQDQFGFYDACDAQAPATLMGTRPSLFFSLVTLAVTDESAIVRRLDAICNCCAQVGGYHTCLATLKPLAAVVAALDLSSLATFAGNLALAMTQLNLSMIQLGMNGTSPVFLTQPAIAQEDPWSFCGWAMVYDWLQGTREAVEFDTDAGVYRILTAYTAPSQLPASPLELPNQVCAYVWLILLYSSLLTGAVATLVLLASLRSPGCQVFAFHRVASLVWVGRPFLMLRGTTALVILSTSPMQFASTDSFTRFTFVPRTPWDVMVLSGEATWITYVLVDLALPGAESHAKLAAPLSALIAWLTTLLIEVAAPYEATATFEQSCEIVQLGLAASCTGGVVRIGSRERLGVLLLVHVSSVVVSFLVVMARQRRGSITDVRGSDLLPASAQVFLARHATWHTRPTTVIMAGMFPLGGRMFVVNLWQVLAVNNALQLPSQSSYSCIRNFTLWKFGLVEVGGIVYVITSVVASYTYIYVSSTAMANDFWWATFNATGHQTFVTNWFTQQLQVHRNGSHLDLTQLIYSDNSNLYNTTATAISEGVAARPFLGGDITCPVQGSGETVQVFYSNVGVCAGHKEDVLVVDGLMTTQALLALGPGVDINATCAHATMQSSGTCNAVFRASLLFLLTLFSADEWTSVSNAAPTAYLQSELPVAIAHYINASTSDGAGHIELRNETVLDPRDPGFHAFGWLYLFEWLSGIREVVEFHSIRGSLALLSTRNPVHIGPVNALEIPVNVAFFFRCELLYVSSVLLFVACLAIAYIAATRGCIEGFNMFSLNRVTGLVWLGRPLLMLRGVTALCLLSTAKLDLGESHGFFYLVSLPQSWFTTIMAAGEATWVVYLLNDAFSISGSQPPSGASCRPSSIERRWRAPAT
ncbi:hypothetical protein SDRG_01101 [Saprolegnia diclina VS20]|uniref:Uncharacterized protein n=1 Tax=Saprolegnia diclina (strain VS20) TaxID=1156394 RepID=T0SE22_SAPDV|nr:hypothetical protein SDRG_01101 [Saprolegnia diclina VS20]EQC41122.1 hypothetical protein SDRG_01101 [Saprolegnia diclina VS20]|eukprot:XP_008604836.1 hypothetical protein SDRG_01101 [Saprolegnia diclina VS20]